MAYPSRPRLDPLPEFIGTATIKQTPEQRQRLIEFCAREYEAGRSIRQVAELTDRTQTAVRRALTIAGVKRHGPGAYRLETTSAEEPHLDD